MELITYLMDFVLHVDRHIGVFVQTHGVWVYALLFAIVFVETGVVVMPFLPGDSLLFITGALCGGRVDLGIGFVRCWLFVWQLGVGAQKPANHHLGSDCGARFGGHHWLLPGLTRAPLKAPSATTARASAASRTGSNINHHVANVAPSLHAFVRLDNLSE